MLVSDVLSFSRIQAQTDANGLTNTKGLSFANEALVDFHRQLVNRGVDASQLQEAYCDGVVPATLGNGSTFAYPSDMLFLKAIEVNYKSTNPQDYNMATQIDVSNISGQFSFSWLRLYCDRMSPQFDDHGDWYEIFPAFTSSDNLTQAIRLFYFLKPTTYTSVGDTVAYPESLDVALLGWRVAAMYYYSLNKMVEGDAFNAKYQERVDQYVATLGRGSQQPVQASALPITGWQY